MSVNKSGNKPIRRALVSVYDKTGLEELARGLHEAIRGSELVVLPGAGHVCNVDAPDPFNATLRSFLRQHAPR